MQTATEFPQTVRITAGHIGPELFNWIAVYSDGRQCAEWLEWPCAQPDANHIAEDRLAGDRGYSHSFACLSLDNFAGWILVPTEHGLVSTGIKNHILIPMPEHGNPRPIFIRRRIINDVLGNQHYGGSITIAGWQQTRLTAYGKRKNVKSLLAVWPDGRIMLTDDDKSITG